MLSNTADPATASCMTCGAPVATAWKFCRNCGSTLTNGVAHGWTRRLFPLVPLALASAVLLTAIGLGVADDLRTHGRLSDTQRQLDSTNAALSSTQSTLSSLQADVASMRATLSTTQSQLSTTQSQLSSVQADRDGLKADRQEISALNTCLTAVADALVAAGAGDTATAVADLDSSSTTCQHAQANLPSG